MNHYFTNNDNLESSIRYIVYKYDEVTISFMSDLGVFAKDKIDYGSRLLVETYIKEGRSNVTLLDVGCGYGFIGLTLAKIKDTHATMIDINRRALDLTKMNMEANKLSGEVYESNIYENVKSLYDVIITNPPIHSGKETVYKILYGAKGYLRNDGELWFVMRKEHGLKSMMEKLKSTYSISIREKSKGFYIICAKKCIDNNIET